MGCLTIIIIILILAVMIKVIEIALIFLPIVLMSLSVVMLFYSISSRKKYINNNKLLPTEMKCPNCQSTQIRINSIVTGESEHTNVTGSGRTTSFDFFGYQTYGKIDGASQKEKNYTFQRQGICQNCGFNFDYFTQEEIDDIKSDSKKTYEMSVLLFIMSAFISLIAMFALIPDTNVQDTNNNNIWNIEYTPIEDFDYYIDGNNVYLKEYIGNSKKIRIDNSYNINGKIYNVISFADGVFALKNVYSVILPEGLTTIPANTFNSSDIKYVYIPVSLKPDNSKYPFYKYFHDMEKIYYGGTEEQWKKLTNNAKRSEIDAKEILYNINIINEL